MQTQRTAKPATVSLLLPPLRLEFEITQRHKNRAQIHARAYSGTHCFVHRAVDVFYDSFGEIPAMVGSSMLSWTLWLVQVEAQRREADPKQRRQLQLRFPDWPSATSLIDPVEDVTF